MNSKKLFLWPVVISLVGHVALIGASSFVDLRENVKAAEFFSVHITSSEPLPEPKSEEKKTEEKKPDQQKEAKAVQPQDTDREDTVDLGSSDIKYADYLASVKKKILRLWITSAVYRKNGKGEVIILMTLNADGSLEQVSTATTSGFPDVDQATLKVIRGAAPFRPLPRQYDLSRLHITASFRYGTAP